MTVVVRAPASHEAERRYVLTVVLAEWLGLDFELVLEDRSDVSIRLVGDPQDRVLLVADILLATPNADWLSERVLPVRPLARLSEGKTSRGRSDGPQRARPLPILYAKPDPDDRPLRRGGHETTVMIDIFGSVFYLLTRYEEVVLRRRDAHGRFPAAASLGQAEDFLDRPIADEYVDVLWEEMQRLWPGLRRRKTCFQLRLTHDVDRPWATVGPELASIARAAGGDLIRRRDPALAARRLRAVVDARSGRVDRDPFNTFDLLMETSERHGLRGTFFFMAGTTDPRFDASYRISDPRIVTLLKQIDERGHEVGLHGSYGTLDSAHAIRTEVESLEVACQDAGIQLSALGVRQHYLRFEVPVTWRAQAAAGLAYDSSLGFAEVNGFRAGTCREYPVFDLVEGSSLGLRERPLIFMDAASDEHLAHDFSGAMGTIRTLVAECRHHDGDAVLLYHNSSLASAGQRAHYREVVESILQPV